MLLVVPKKLLDGYLDGIKTFWEDGNWLCTTVGTLLGLLITNVLSDPEPNALRESNTITEGDLVGLILFSVTISSLCTKYVLLLLIPWFDNFLGAAKTPF